MNKSIPIKADSLLIDIPRQTLHLLPGVKHTAPYTPMATEPEFDTINVWHSKSWPCVLLCPAPSQLIQIYNTKPPRWCLFIWTQQLKLCMKLLRDFLRRWNIPLHLWLRFLSTKLCRGTFFSPLPTILPSASASTLPFFPCLSNRILSLFPSASLSTGFSSWFSAIPLFGQFSSLCLHLPSFPLIHFKHSNVLFLCVAPGLSIWHITQWMLSSFCIFCPLSFLTVHST